MSARANLSLKPNAVTAEAQGIWAIVAQAVASCKKSDLPEPEEQDVFDRVSTKWEYYVEHADDTAVYGVHIYGVNKEEKVPFAVADLVAHSQWFKAYVDNRQVIPHGSFLGMIILKDDP